MSALTVTRRYRQRWQVALFVTWINQHLHIKSLFGTSETAVKTQGWIAVSAYVLDAIIKKRLNLPALLCEILQTLSLTMFKQSPLERLLPQ